MVTFEADGDDPSVVELRTEPVLFEPLVVFVPFTDSDEFEDGVVVFEAVVFEPVVFCAVAFLFLE